MPSPHLIEMRPARIAGQHLFASNDPLVRAKARARHVLAEVRDARLHRLSRAGFWPLFNYAAALVRDALRLRSSSTH